VESSIEEYWVDFRRFHKKSKNRSPSQLRSVVEWVHNQENPARKVFQVVREADRDHVSKFLSGRLVLMSPNEVNSLGHTDILIRLSRNLTCSNRNDVLAFEIPYPNPFGWDLLWGLVACREVTIPENLLGMVSRRSPISDFYRALVEVRFESMERHSLPSIEDSAVTLGNWLEGKSLDSALLQKVNARPILRTEDQVELLLFLMTICYHNRVLDSIILCVNELESLTTLGCERVYQLIGALERWVLFGCPLNLLLGWGGTKDNQAILQQKHGRLWALLCSDLRA